MNSIRKFIIFQLFEKLKIKRPQSLEKLVPISGDMNNPHLGLSYDSEKVLVEKVSLKINILYILKNNI